METHSKDLLVVISHSFSFAVTDTALVGGPLRLLSDLLFRFVPKAAKRSFHKPPGFASGPNVRGFPAEAGEVTGVA